MVGVKSNPSLKVWNIALRLEPQYEAQVPALRFKSQPQSKSYNPSLWITNSIFLGQLLLSQPQPNCPNIHWLRDNFSKPAAKYLQSLIPDMRLQNLLCQAVSPLVCLSVHQSVSPSVTLSKCERFFTILPCPPVWDRGGECIWPRYAKKDNCLKNLC